MGKTFRNYKGNEYPDKSQKKKASRKSFMFSGDLPYAKANGGPGLKRGWAGDAEGGPSGTGHPILDRGQYQKYKDFPSIFDTEDNPFD